ncbi:hypothetical protein IE81DRAFT_341528 [Ceraceosorus guamensis]|uniref:Uncharacterized protein n=1 Tax=Ceraceosorus guamensis TaxID=1522189 RepID=A0A316W0W3_9BASI|nr:hypothetical protein IE81DRAFT_341528 [Ceraceosorus guamensis]PWN42191.1 hypothetical protein IE81DRAFT_341528 [Ceraceosorus guamensis]
MVSHACSDPFPRLPAEIMHTIREFHSPRKQESYRHEEHVLLAISQYWFRIVMAAKWRHLEAPVNRVLAHIETYKTFPWLRKEIQSLEVGGDYPMCNFAKHTWGYYFDYTMLDPSVRFVPPLQERIFMDLRRILRVPFYGYHSGDPSHPDGLKVDKDQYKLQMAARQSAGSPPCRCEMCQRIDEPNWPFPESPDFYDDDAFTVRDQFCSDPEVFWDFNGPYGTGPIPGISCFSDYWKAVDVLLSLVRPEHLRLVDRASPVPKFLASAIASMGCVKRLDIPNTIPYYYVPAHYTRIIANIEELNISLGWVGEEVAYLDHWDGWRDEENDVAISDDQRETRDEDGNDCHEVPSANDEDAEDEDESRDERAEWVPDSLGYVNSTLDAQGRHTLKLETRDESQRLIDDAPPNSLSGRLLELVESGARLRRLTLLDPETCVALFSARLLPIFATLDAVDTFITKPGSARELPTLGVQDPGAHLAYTIPLSSLRVAFLALAHDSDPPRALRESDVHKVADQPDFWILSENLHKMASAIVQKFNERENLRGAGHPDTATKG